MKIDKEKIEFHIREILKAIGEDPEREGLLETPKRVAKMYEEVFEGTNYTNREIANMFNKTFEENLTYNKKDMVCVKDIEFFSFCEHHMALMYNMKASITYLPKNKVIGISKLARIVDMVGRRLQLQERIGSDIAEIIEMITESQDIKVEIEGSHSCMSSRGIRQIGAKTLTTTLRGRFENKEIN